MRRTQWEGAVGKRSCI